MRQHTLQCHPDTPCSLAIKLSVTCLSLKNGDIHLKYHLEGDINQLFIPVLTPSTQADNLWKTSCFEAFIAVKGAPAYYEYNISPSSQWAAYRFADYRETSPWSKPQAPTIQRLEHNKKLVICVTLPSSLLPSNPHNKTLQLGLSSVIEDCHGNLSYWALTHRADKPDFHHRDSFSLNLNPNPNHPRLSTKSN